MTTANLKPRAVSCRGTNLRVFYLQHYLHDAGNTLKASYNIAVPNGRECSMPIVFDTRRVARRCPFSQMGSTLSTQRIRSF